MKKVLCRELGPPERLTVAECAPPSLAAGQVRIAVHACGVNFPDTLIVQGLYQWRPDLPFTPGGEVAGVVSEIAPDVSSFAVGDRVVAITIWGGFSEEVVVDTTHVTRMTPSMSMVQAAGFTMTYATSFHALDYRARLQPGETLLVLGAAGGVGITAVELGKRMGARVIAAAVLRDCLPPASAPWQVGRVVVWRFTDV